MAVEQDLKIMILSQKKKKKEAVGRKNELPFSFFFFFKLSVLENLSDDFSALKDGKIVLSF